MRNLSRKPDERHERDLYRTPQDVIDRLAEVYRPAFPGPRMVCDPCAGDGRIGTTIADAVGAVDLRLSDLHAQEGVVAGDVLVWERPDFDGRVIVTINPPFNLLDAIVSRIWSQLQPRDELVVLISSICLANYSRPVLWRELGIMPFADEYHVRWRCPFEQPNGTPMKGAAMCHQWVRSVKGYTPIEGMTRAWNLLKRR